MSPLFELDSVVVTPHLGASTREAQDKAGETIAEQVLLALSGGFVPYAVNVSATEASETVRPFLPLAERLGRLFASLNDGVPSALEVEYQGHLADYDTRILTLAVLKGLLGAGSEEPVSYVNAPQLATERGVVVRESKTSEAKDYVNLISLRGDDHGLAGTLFGLRNEARLVMVDDHTVDIPPSSHMVVVRNDDRPGMIGLVGMTFGRAGVNISDMDVGVSPSGEAALMVISTDRPLPAEVLDDLRAPARHPPGARRQLGVSGRAGSDMEVRRIQPYQATQGLPLPGLQPGDRRRHRAPGGRPPGRPRPPPPLAPGVLGVPRPPPPAGPGQGASLPRRSAVATGIPTSAHSTPSHRRRGRPELVADGRAGTIRG